MTLSKEAKRKMMKDIMISNEKSFKKTIPYANFEGLCDVCGVILNPDRYIKIGARDLCGAKCYEARMMEPFDGFQHTSMNDRDKMRKIVKVLNDSKSGNIEARENFLKGSISSKLRYFPSPTQCHQCGCLLEVHDFYTLGATKFCEQSCYDIWSWAGTNVQPHPALPEAREELRVKLSKLGVDKNGNQTVTFSEEEVYQQPGNYGQWKQKSDKKKESTVLELSKDVHEIDIRTAEDITGIAYNSELKPGTDSWVTYQCDPELMILGARELIDRYLSNLDKLEVYRSTLNEITSNVNSIEEPLYLEDISEWPNYINNKKSLEELGKQQIADLNKDIDKLLKENDQMGHLMYYSNEIPNRKYIRSGDKGIFIGISNRTINIDVRKWEYVKRIMAPPITKEDEKKNKVAVPSKAKEIAHNTVMCGFLIMIFGIAPVVWIGITGSYWGIVAGLVTNLLFYLASRVDY